MTYHDQVHRHVEATRRRMDLLLGGGAGGDVGGPARRVADELYAAIEELQVSEEELRVQNESLAASELLLQEERARYAELFHLAPDPYLVTTLDGAVREANHAAAALLGWRRNGCAGNRWRCSWPPGGGASSGCGCRRWPTRGAPTTGSWPSLRAAARRR